MTSYIVRPLLRRAVLVTSQSPALTSPLAFRNHQKQGAENFTEQRRYLSASLSSYQKPKFAKKYRKSKFIDDNDELSEDDLNNNLENVERFSHVFSSFRDENLSEMAQKFRDNGDNVDTDWKEIQEMCEKSPYKRLQKYWPSLMLNLFEQLNYPLMAKSLFDFISTCELEPHLAFLSIYINLQGKNNNFEQVLRAYELVNTEILDVESATKIIQGLCRTEKWRDCLKILEESRITSKDSMTRLGPVIVAALENGEHTLAVDLVRHGCQRNLQPSFYIFDAFSSHADEKLMWEFLTLVGECNYFMQNEQTVNFRKWLDKHGFRTKLARIDRRGKCSSCLRQLRPSRLSAREFETLKDTFMEKSVIRGDIFISTTPEEMEKFQQFLQKNRPFDVAIDALNVAHTGRRWDMRIVLKTVNLFLRKGKNVLVVSRQHSAADNRFMRELKCPIFYTSDISKDDPFVLYAALWSGPQCEVVTRDEMRDHCFLLGEEIAPIFRKWQRGHQVMIGSVRPNGSPELVFPPIHEVVPQKTGSTWHVPYDNEDERMSFALPDTWLCAKKT